MRSSTNTTLIDADRHFTALGAGYENEAFASPGLRWISARELEAVRAALADVPAGATVLDAGAGNGRVTAVLGQELHLGVTALDAVPEMLETIRRRNPGTATVLARLGAPLPFETETFDAVVALRVLKWVPAWEHALTELARVLLPGGRIVVEITNRHSLARFGYRHAVVTTATRSGARDVGRRAGIQWDDELAGTHLPFAAWRAAGGGLGLRAVIASQRGVDHLLGPIGARSVVLVGTKTPDGQPAPVGG